MLIVWLLSVLSQFLLLLIDLSKLFFVQFHGVNISAIKLNFKPSFFLYFDNAPQVSGIFAACRIHAQSLFFSYLIKVLSKLSISVLRISFYPQT